MNGKDYQKILAGPECAKMFCNYVGYDWKTINENIDEFKNRYAKEIFRRLQTLPGEHDKDEKTAMQISDQYYTYVRWNLYKKIYDFHPSFARYLATTESGIVYKDVFSKLPFDSFYISYGTDSDIRHYNDKSSGMFVRVYIREDWVGLSIVTVFPDKTPNNNTINLRHDADNNYQSRTLFVGIQDGTSFEDATNIDKLDKSVLEKYGIKEEDLPEVREKTERNKPFFMLALNACQYLCASNAEIKDIKTSKKDKPVVKSSNGKAKPVTVNVSQVGFRIGQRFEKMYQDLETECRRESKKGFKKRPHVRRAHWHHYWTGQGRTVLTVKWLEPIFVVGSDDEIDTVVHKVKGDKTA